MLCSLLQQESENTIKVAAIGLIRTLPHGNLNLEISIGFLNIHSVLGATRKEKIWAIVSLT